MANTPEEGAVTSHVVIVARAMGIPPPDAQRIAHAVPARVLRVAAMVADGYAHGDAPARRATASLR